MKDARERAAAYLNIKPRTKMQVIRYLKSKGYEEDEINDAVTELEEYRYIDDFSFSVMYFQYGFEKGRGIMRIKRELAEKGVDHDYEGAVRQNGAYNRRGRNGKAQEFICPAFRSRRSRKLCGRGSGQSRCGDAYTCR